MAQPLNRPPAVTRSHHAEWYQARRCRRRATARSARRQHRHGVSMQVLIVATSDDALGRPSQLEAPGVVLHWVASLAQAGVALQAQPRIDVILLAATAARPAPYPRRAPQ
jgi:hypothetical protein